MRYKILDAIRIFMGIGNVEGVVEMDETFVAESFKGNHKKSGSIIPRPSRKRGIVKSKNMLVHSTVEFVDTKIENFKGKIPVFV